jgi:ribosome-binding protein aMBF1 (putative translation factor)
MKPTSPERASLYARESYRTIITRVAANTRRLREARAWTQVDAAAECSMATFMLQTVESGRRNVSATTLARLCDGFKVDVQELLQPAAPLATPKQGRPPKTPPTAPHGEPESPS